MITRATRSTTESKMQARIIKDLEGDGWLVNKVVVCNNTGWPDVQAYRDGVCIFIECKAQGKKATPIQTYQQNRIFNHGFTVATIDSWEEYLKFKQKISNNETSQRQLPVPSDTR